MRKLLAIVLFGMSDLSFAACNTDQMDSQIDESGLFHRRYDERSWHVGNAEDLLYLAVDMDDGDVTWTGIIERDSQASIAWVNKIHLEWRYVQLALDPDFDLVATFSVPHWQEGCPADFVDNSKFFLRMLGDLKSDLEKFRSEDYAGVIGELRPLRSNTDYLSL